MEKKQKKMPLYVPILWFIAFGCWCVNFAIQLSSPYTAESTLVLAALAGLGALAAALANLWRWKRDKDDPDKV